MAIVQLPSHTGHRSVINALDKHSLFTDHPEKIAVHMPDASFVYPSAIGFLAAWGIYERIRHNTKLVITGDDNSRRYLSRMDLMTALESPFTEDFKRKPAAGRFLPVTLVDDDNSAKYAVDSICDLVLHQFEDPRPFLPALEWAVSEITDNILIHSESKTPGVVCAQYFDTTHRLGVAIVDCGRGLKASLQESMHVCSHGDAISQAVQRGVTRDSDVGMGNGLAGTLEISRVNGGDFKLWSGNVSLHVKGGKDQGFTEHAEVPGTGVYLSLDTRKPVNLSETFIQGRGNGDEDFLTAAVKSGGLLVAEEVEHTGSRRPATHFRRKVLTLLQESDEPIELDFSGISRASSSFLDELLGRLADELGSNVFTSRVKVVNITPQICAMANVVIKQRLQGLS
jgi:hypothetical protein